VIILGNKELTNGLLIYPNPVSNQIKIQVPIELNGEINMSINDNLGKIMGNITTIINGQFLGLEWLKPGTYYLNFSQKGGTYIKTIKIIKE
jgi:hypothetical protein